MKRIITLFAIAAISVCAFAQKQESPAPDHKKHHERFQAEKVAFLTNEMDLTVEEAQVFWPVYNEYSKAADDAHRTAMTALDKIRKNKELSDDEASAAIASLVAARQQETALMAEYTEKFKKVLPMKKVAALYAAEEGFRQHLFSRFKAGDGHKGPRVANDQKGPKGLKGPKGSKGTKDPKEPKDKTQK
ncbi:MAG: hypothetical protein IJS30_06680 [Bacteroidales bacterium]|nr:hypothetical protein [Bacteroidales bacterium]